MFSLYLKEDLNEDGSLKVSETVAKEKAVGVNPQDQPCANKGGVDYRPEIIESKPETSADDVD